MITNPPRCSVKLLTFQTPKTLNNKDTMTPLTPWHHEVKQLISKTLRLEVKGQVLFPDSIEFWYSPTLQFKFPLELVFYTNTRNHTWNWNRMVDTRNWKVLFSFAPPLSRSAYYLNISQYYKPFSAEPKWPILKGP